jgi:hypothetical protein
MSRFRIVVVLLLLACLPLKVVAAVTMPFCADAAAPVAGAAAMDHAAMDHAGHGVMPDGAPDGIPGAAATATHAPVTDCGECGLCHLACASALPMRATEFRIRFAPVLVADAPGAFVSFIPEVLFRPPLHAHA